AQENDLRPFRGGLPPAFHSLWWRAVAPPLKISFPVRSRPFQPNPHNVIDCGRLTTDFPQSRVNLPAMIKAVQRDLKPGVNERVLRTKPPSSASLSFNSGDCAAARLQLNVKRPGS